jgi:hypothetical protein
MLVSSRSMTKIVGFGSGSISQRHGSADPNPAPHQNVMDPEHCRKPIFLLIIHIWLNPELFRLGGSGFEMNLCNFT